MMRQVLLTLAAAIIGGAIVAIYLPHFPSELPVVVGIWIFLAVIRETLVDEYQVPILTVMAASAAVTLAWMG